MSRLIHAGSVSALAFCAATASTVARAQEPQLQAAPVVVARALGSLPDRQVVEFVARNAEPIRHERDRRPDLALKTPRQIIEWQCGSVQPGYVAELARSNGQTGPALDEPAGEAAFTMQWPACLYARKYEKPMTYTVKTNDTLLGIRERFAGPAAYDPKAIDDYFSGSGYTAANAKALKTGTSLPIPLTTSTTVLKPRISGDAFIKALKITGGENVSGDANPSPPGDIIGPVKFVGESASSTPGKFPACIGADATTAYPFDAHEVEEAYRVARDRNQNSPTRLSIVVMDNGHFGAPCTNAACPVREGIAIKESDRFPKRYFDHDRFSEHYGFGPTISGSLIEPLNYLNTNPLSGTRFLGKDVNEETGHGTHVSGLVLGGPAFAPLRRNVFEDGFGKPWLTLVIANLSNASPKLHAGSDGNLDQLLRDDLPFRIVNMSLAFDARIGPMIAANVERALRDDQRTLYVAAAGNSGTSLEWSTNQLYPARLGGESNEHVITVASIDAPANGTQRLSTFSNRSAKYVDLAAPGCRIQSWIDADREPIEISGTSQAAPIVSFTMAMLQSLWATTPGKLKNRALYGGDLLESEDDRRAVRSMSQLNIAKTLTYHWDRVTYREGEQLLTKLGKISLVQGLQCDDGRPPIPPSGMRAVKKSRDGRLAIFWTESSKLANCWGALDPQSTVTIEPPYRSVANGRITDDTAMTDIVIAAENIVEIVRSK